MMSLELIKVVRFKDNKGKLHAYAAKFLFIDGGFKMSEEDFKTIQEIINTIK